MADKKITQLTEDTAPTSDDLVVTVNDPAGTPVSRKVTLNNLGKGVRATTQSVVTGSRALGSIYQNTTGKVLYVAVSVNMTGIGSLFAFADDSNPPTTLIISTSNQIAYNASVFFLVLPGYYYKATIDTTGNLGIWVEWY